jgi:predicted small metal-binding protein
MKTVACGDVIPGCSGDISTPDEDGIFAWAAAHAAEVHGITEVTPELVAAIRAKIVTV